jgi:hypothetical protein
VTNYCDWAVLLSNVVLYSSIFFCLGYWRGLRDGGG